VPPGWPQFTDIRRDQMLCGVLLRFSQRLAAMKRRGHNDWVSMCNTFESCIIRACHCGGIKSERPLGL